MKSQSLNTKIWLALLALYIVWGSTYLGIRIAIETIPPFLHAAIRFFISGLIIVIWQRISGQPLSTGKQWISCTIIGTLLLVGGNGTVAWAEQFIPSGIAALIVAAVPMFMVMIEALRPGGARPNWQSILGLCIGFVGIYILIGPSDHLNESSLNPWGVLALLGACVSWSMGSVYSKSAELPASSFMTTGVEMLMGSIGLFVVSLFTHELHGWSINAVSMPSMLSLLYLIFVGSIVGFGSYIWLLKHAPISLVSTYAYVNPIVAILLGSWIAHESVGPHIWLAAAIIIGSIMLVKNKKKSKISDETKDVAVTE